MAASVGADEARPNRCFYDLLVVDRQASQADIRRAYRRQALRRHPDKRPVAEAADAATEFRQIQRAYEILGDPRTRALYDRHRDKIMGNERFDGEEFQTSARVNVFNYFPPGCYGNKYSDEPGGFFDVYGRLFDQLSAELSAEDAEFTAMPEFGQSNSDYKSTVAPFYAAWESRLNDVRIDDSSQQRRDEIRVLMAFVKAWDPRVLNWRVRATVDLLTGLAEEEAVRASLVRSALAGLAVSAGALIGGALVSSRSRGGSLGLALGAVLAAVAYAAVNRNKFVSIADALRGMSTEKRIRLADLTWYAFRDINSTDSATWASLIVTGAQFRARLVKLVRRFAYGESADDDDGDGDDVDSSNRLEPGSGDSA